MKNVKLLMLGIVAALSTLTAAAQSYLKLADATLEAGKSGNLFLELISDNPLATGFQCDIYFPEGISPTLKDGSVAAVKRTERTEDHSVAGVVQKDGALRILVYNGTNSLFLDDESGSLAVVKIPVEVSENVDAGTYSFTIKKQEISFYDAKATSNRVSYTRPDEVISTVTVTVTTTGIETVEAGTEPAKAVTYTLDGKKTSSVKKGGVYVIDGKKVLVK